MEAPAFWQVYLQAEQEEIVDLVERLAAELKIPVPPVRDTVALPPDRERVVAALDKVQPDWRERALLSPPDSPPAS